MRDSLKQLVEDFHTEEQKQLAEEIEGTERPHSKLQNIIFSI